MKDAVAEMAKNKMGQKERENRNPTDQNTALDRCYGEIGISAVAAAARYRGEAKNLAYAPAATK